MSKKKTKVIDTLKIKIDYLKLPNLFHFQQQMIGSAIHKSKKNIIPRKRKYKNRIDEDGQ